jgi:hypothetical protein
MRFGDRPQGTPGTIVAVSLCSGGGGAFLEQHLSILTDILSCVGSWRAQILCLCLRLPATCMPVSWMSSSTRCSGDTLHYNPKDILQSDAWSFLRHSCVMTGTWGCAEGVPCLLSGLFLLLIG